MSANHYWVRCRSTAQGKENEAFMPESNTMKLKGFESPIFPLSKTFLKLLIDTFYLFKLNDKLLGGFILQKRILFICYV